MVGNVKIEKWPMGSILSLPLLERVTGDITVVAAEGLEKVSMPVLSRVDRSLVMYGLSLTSLEMPALTAVCETYAYCGPDFEPAGCPCRLMVSSTSIGPDLKLPSLTTVGKGGGEGIYVGPLNLRLESLLLPALTYASALWISSNEYLNCVITADDFQTKQVIMFDSKNYQYEGQAHQKPNGCNLQGCFWTQSAYSTALGNTSSCPVYPQGNAACPVYPPPNVCCPDGCVPKKYGSRFERRALLFFSNVCPEGCVPT